MKDKLLRFLVMKRMHVYAITFICLSIALYLLPAINMHSIPVTHEGYRYAFLFHFFQESVLNGNMYPRWIPQLFGGYGYPVFVFYQPGYFFLLLPIHFLVQHPLITYWLGNFFILAFGLIGIFTLCETDKAIFPGIMGIILFLLTPYIKVNLFVRGDLSELLAMMMCPAVFYMCNTLATDFPKIHFSKIIATASLIAAVFMSHPIVFLFLSFNYTLLLLIICLYQSKHKTMRFLTGILPLFLGVGLSVHYWLPVFQLKELVNVDVMQEGYYALENHFVYIKQLFINFWGYGGSHPGVADGMSFQLGLPHFIFACIGFIVSKRPFVKGAFILYIMNIFFITPYSWPLWRLFPFTKIIQFPWRLLSVISVLQIICIIDFLKHHLYIKSAFLRKSVVFLSVIIACCYYANILVDYPETFEGNLSDKVDIMKTVTKQNFDTFDIYEFLPRSAVQSALGSPRGDMRIAEVSDGGVIRFSKYSSEYYIDFALEAQLRSAVRINQIYFPGWRLFINGESVPETMLRSLVTPDGRIEFFLNPGKYLIQARYDQPPGKYLRHAIMLLFLIVCYFSYRAIVMKYNENDCGIK